MIYEDFLEEVRSRVSDYMGEEAEVRVNHVRKNNGVVLDGLTIMEKKKNVSPTIYLNDLYEDYNKECNRNEIISGIIKTYEKSQIKEKINMNFFMDYEKMKSRIAYKLVNYEKNKELLEQIPHIHYLDLAIVFYCYLLSDFLKGATVLIYNSHLELWKVTREEIYEQAKENTPRLFPSELKTMEEVMKEMFENSVKRDIDRSVNGFGINREELDGSDEWAKELAVQMVENVTEGGLEKPMYVLSNAEKVQGAACILYKDMLKKFAKEKQSDFFILPSSIHEVILVPSSGDEEPFSLASMVKEINETQVGEEEVLSDSVYLYKQKEDKIVKIA